MNLFKTEGYYTFSPVFLEITPRYTGFRTVLKEPVGTAGARLFYRPDADRVCHPKNWRNVEMKSNNGKNVDELYKRLAASVRSSI